MFCGAGPITEIIILYMRLAEWKYTQQASSAARQVVQFA